MPVNIFIVDNQIIAIECLKAVLETLPDFKVVGTATNGTEAIARLDQLSEVDVVIMDYLMPTIDGITTMSRLLNRTPKPKYQIIMLSVENDLNTALDSLRKGASGYVLRTSDFKLLNDVIVNLHQNPGRVYMDPGLKRQINNRKEVEFTERELEIIKLILDEYSSQEIAEELDFKARSKKSDDTSEHNPKSKNPDNHFDKSRVETLTRIIREKMGAQNMAGLVRYALENWVCPDHMVKRPSPPVPPNIPFDAQDVASVFIIDNDTIILEGMRTLLDNSTRHQQFQIVGTAPDGEKAINSIKQYVLSNPKVEGRHSLVVVIDIELSGMDGLTATAAIKKQFPEVAVLICTMHDSYRKMEKAVESGASGYVTKNIRGSDLVQVIWAIWKGENYFEVQYPPADQKFDTLEMFIIKMVWDQHNNHSITQAIKKWLKSNPLPAYDAEKWAEHNTETKRRAIMRRMNVNGVVGMIKYIWLNRLCDPD